jgi:HlyD family secretion protein
MKKRLRILLPLLLVVLLGTLLYNYFKGKEQGAHLRLSGNIEVTEAQLSFRIAGKLAQRLVDEGQQVKSGEVLARLDNGDQTIAVTMAEANLAHAEAVLAEMVAGSRSEDLDRAAARVAQARESLSELERGNRSEEVERGRAELAAARAAEQTAQVVLAQARIDFDRYHTLFKQDSVSTTLFETYRNNLQTAENRAEESRARTRVAIEQLNLLKSGARIEQRDRAAAALKQAEAEYALVKAGARQESIDQGRAKVAAAAAALDQARRQLSHTELLSPMDGTVLSTAAEPGEYLNPASPVLTIGDLGRPWLRAYINERDLGRVKLQQEATVATDSYPGKTYPGRITYIGSQAEFTPKTVQTFEERVKLMYRVKISLTNQDNELKPGMPADARLDFAER